ncbi:MAG: polysaccharide biosynthesis C-terminal domain-containing protein, partial [Desulfobacterales bacterium]|nr:polysaccharide biosynthesis C-terminal domain-containing protein [Desulfobacterales bacterium]
ALLFERGAFDPISSRLTADALMYFSFGLWAFSAVRIVVSTFYALQDTKTPVKIAAISVFANIVLCLTLMKPLAHAGLALAASISSMLNFILLAMALRKKLGPLGGKKIIESISKSVVCSLVMGASLQIFINLNAAADTPSVFSRLWVVFAGILFGICVYALTAYSLKSRELIDIMKIVKKG